jgi:hypothetical protein
MTLTKANSQLTDTVDAPLGPSAEQLTAQGLDAPTFIVEGGRRGHDH